MGVLDAMTDLIQRLADGPGSRELSDEVLLACGWERQKHGPMYFRWHSPNGRGFEGTDIQYRPDPTRSVDDALALVPEGWTRGVLSWPGYDNGKLTADFRADLHHSLSSGGGPRVSGYASSLPRAICIAVLRI